MQSYKRKTDLMMTWIDIVEADARVISRADYEQLVALLEPSAGTENEAFVITRLALERLLRSIAVGLIHSGQ